MIEYDDEEEVSNLRVQEYPEGTTSSEEMVEGDSGAPSSVNLHRRKASVQV